MTVRTFIYKTTLNTSAHDTTKEHSVG